MRRACLFAAVLLMTAVGRAQSPRALVQEGNAHYAAGRYAEALERYEKAGAAGERADPAIVHNRAAALFKLGDRQAARDLWVQLKESGDPRLEARTKYNLGNCDYFDALAAMGQPQDALKLLEQAARQYREALKLDPELTDARANLELTGLLRRQIEQQMPPPQSQPSSQPTSQPSSQPQSQPSSQPQSQPSSQPQSRPSSQPSSQPGEQGTPPQPREPQPDQQPPDEPQKEDAQEQPPEEPEREQGENRELPPPETQPTETQPAQTQPALDPNTPAGQMSREQAARLLQMIRDAEKARRERLLQQRLQKQPPVERDW